MAYELGVDLGTTFTAAALHRDGEVEVVELGGRAATIPSVVYVRDDGAMLIGDAAVRRAISEPASVSREFKRRIGDPTPIFVAGQPFAAETLSGHLLRAVVDQVAEREGGPPERLAVTHPANWGTYKLSLLKEAIAAAGFEDVLTLAEPEAAAIHYATLERVDPGRTVGVFDLGGGTFDASILRKLPEGFEVLGRPEGIERLGGIDFDEAVFAQVNKSLAGSLAQLDPEDPAAMAAVARLRDDCADAKEVLSVDTQVTIPVVLPTVQTEIRITRAELEQLIRPSLGDAIGSMRRAVRGAGIELGDLDVVLLVGGSSRIPLVAQLVAGELGRPVAVDVHPKHSVAMGAAWAAAGAGAAEEAAAVTAAPPAVPPPPATPTVDEAPEVAAAPTPTRQQETAVADAVAPRTPDAASTPDAIPDRKRETAVTEAAPPPLDGSNNGDEVAASAAVASAASPPPPPPTVPTAPEILPVDQVKDRQTGLLVGGALVIIAAIVAGVFLVRGGGDGDDGPTDVTTADTVAPTTVAPPLETEPPLTTVAPPPETEAPAPPTELTPLTAATLGGSGFDLATIPLGPNPVNAEVGFGSLWVAMHNSSEVWRINVDTLEIEARIFTGPSPLALLPTSRGLWVGNANGNTVSLIDPDANAVVAEIEVGPSPFGMTSVEGSVFVAVRAAQQIVEIDEATATVVSRSPDLGAEPATVQLSGNALWAAGVKEFDVVWRLQVRDLTAVETFPQLLGPDRGDVERPGPIHFEANTTCQCAYINYGEPDVLLQLDPFTGAEIGRVDVGRRAIFRIGPDALWVAPVGSTQVQVLDPDTLQLIGLIETNSLLEERLFAVSEEALFVFHDVGGGTIGLTRATPIG
ncbi:MAG: Hsp70 family protein [Actinomycetota bacterium]